MKISVLLKITELLIFFRQIWKQPTRVAFGSCISPDQCLQCARSQSQGEQIIRIQSQWLFIKPYGKLPPTNCAVFSQLLQTTSIPTFSRFFKKNSESFLKCCGDLFWKHWFQVNNWSRGVCPKGRMSCIGKFRRNLVTMRETLYFYIFEKVVFFLDVALTGVSSNFTPEALFWAHNAIILLQTIGRMSFYSLIINSPNSKVNSVLPTASVEPKFYVLKSQFLEPRRPSPISNSEGKGVGANCSSSSEYLLVGEAGPSHNPPRNVNSKKQYVK